MANPKPQQDIRKSPGRPKKKPIILSPQQEQFVDKYLSTGNMTLAAKEAGYSEKTIPTNICKSERVQEVLIQKQQQIHNQFIQRSQQALDRIIYLIDNAKSDRVKLDAAKDLLDRAGFKPVEKRETTTLEGISLDSRISQELAQRAIKLMEEKTINITQEYNQQ